MFVFHNYHGTKVVLSDNQVTAERRNLKSSYNKGIVMSRDPMQVNKLYEVRSVRVSDIRVAAAAT